jgi:hypothetical protein
MAGKWKIMNKTFLFFAAKCVAQFEVLCVVLFVGFLRWRTILNMPGILQQQQQQQQQFDTKN